MSTAPWVCRQCARTVLRGRRPAAWAPPVRIPFRRQASSDVSPALLQRARRLAAEHDALQQRLASEYDGKAAKRAGEIQGVARALAAWEAAEQSVCELRAMAQDADEDAELRKLAEAELAATRSRLDALGGHLSEELAPKHPFAHMACLLEFRPGPGGLESRFFTDSLFRMYQSFCTRQGFRARVIKYEVSDSLGETGSDGETALQEAVLEVQQPGAYDLFRGEAGIHRVQRIPVTEKNGRTHTSVAAVWVLPAEPPASGSGSENDGGSAESSAEKENPESDLYINPAEVRTEIMRARGAGGQHVNKTESAVRLTHMPTGTTVSMQDSRSQHQNRDNAWKILRARIAQRRREARDEEARRLRDAVLAQSQVTRADKIRTYNYSQDRVTDHRCGLDVHNLPDVLAGGDTLARVVQAVRAWQREKDIEALLAEEEAAVRARERGKS